MTKKLKRWIERNKEDLSEYTKVYSVDDFDDFFYYYGNDPKITRILDVIMNCYKKYKKKKLSKCDKLHALEDFVDKKKITMCEIKYEDLDNAKKIKKMFKSKKQFEKLIFRICKNTTLKNNKKQMRKYAIGRLSLTKNISKNKITYEDIETSIFKDLFETKKSFYNFKSRLKKEGEI